MDTLKNAVGMGGDDQKGSNQQSQGGLGGIGDKLNVAAVGASLGGKNERSDAIQDHGLGQSQNTVDAAVDQADNEQISEFLRSQCKSNTGKDLMAAQRDAAQADREARQT